MYGTDVNPRHPLRQGIVRLGAVGAAILVVVVLTVTRSEATFSVTTGNAGNAFATGTVTLTDDDTGSALFSVSNLTPGSPVTRCIVVSYTGSNLPAPVRTYGTSSGDLAPYLTTTIEVGTGGTFADCTGFTGSQVFSGFLDSFSTTHTGWSNGLALFTAAANPTSRTIRYTVSVANDPAAQGRTATAGFTFEAQG